jgi:hypothetical protein
MMLAASNPRAKDAAAYREMVAEFRRLVASQPQRSRYLVARDAGLHAFGVSLADVMSDSRKAEIAQPRMKIMAAVMILTGNNRSAVGRTFNRWPESINHAVELFGEDVRQALRGIKPDTISAGAKSKADHNRRST